MKNYFVIAAIATLGTTFSATAQSATGNTNTPRIDKKEANEQARIANGVKTGALTPGETVKLEKQQGRIENAEARAKADGNVTKGERKHLNHMENNASKNIYRKKHNAKKAG